MTATSMMVLIRWGVLDPDFVWKELATFSNGSLRYTLKQSNAVMNPEMVQYLIEMSVEGVPIRRAKVGVLMTALRGVNYEFMQLTPDPFVMFFNQVKPHYVHGVVDDWFTIAMSIGTWYYMNDLQVFAADVWEAEQQRMLKGVQPDFHIDITGLELRPDENDIDQSLDDRWNKWGEDDDDLYD